MILRVLSGVRLPKVWSPIRMTGACEHAPMHTTELSVNSLSLVVLPSAMPSSSSRASVICGAPATWQAVP